MSYTVTLFEIAAGYDIEFRFTVTDAAGTAVDVTGFTDFELIAKRRRTDTAAEAVFRLTQSGGDLTVGTDDGGPVDGTVTGADTAGLSERRYRLYADFNGVIGGLTKPLMTGLIPVEPSVRFSTP